MDSRLESQVQHLFTQPIHLFRLIRIWYRISLQSGHPYPEYWNKDSFRCW